MENIDIKTHLSRNVKEEHRNNENDFFTNFSIAVAYVAGVSFGFHLTTLEIIKKIYFVNSSIFTLHKFYFLAALLFLTPIVGSIIYNRLRMKLTTSIRFLLFLHASSIFGLTIPKIYTFFAFRAMAGVAIGISTVTVPQYIGRMKERQRGFFIFMFQVSIVVGILIGQILSYFTSSELQFRIIFWAFGIINALAAYLSYYIKKPADLLIRIGDHSISDLISDRKHFKSILLTVCIHISQQMTGINGVIIYSNTLLEKGPGNPQLRTIFQGFFSLIVTVVSSFFVDIVGRKILLIASNAIIAVSLLLLTTERFVLAAILLFQFGYSFGSGPITWLLSNELFPVHYQQAGNSICVALNWTCAFLVVVSFEYLLINIGDLVLWFLISCMIIFIIIIYLFFQETKGGEPDFQK